MQLVNVHNQHISDPAGGNPLEGQKSRNSIKDEQNYRFLMVYLFSKNCYFPSSFKTVLLWRQCTFKVFSFDFVFLVFLY